MIFRAERAAFTAAIQGLFLERGEPFLMAQKPLIFRAERAAFTAAIQGLFLALRLAFLLTTRPCLFFTKSVFFGPVLVLSILPEKRWRLASFAEMTFFFMAFIAFMAAMAFMAFMALAIFQERVGVGRNTKSNLLE